MYAAVKKLHLEDKILARFVRQNEAKKLIFQRVDEDQD
jgi:hypothetical protein